MVEFLQALGPDGWGTAGGLALLILGGFIFGKIIPQSTHERELQLWKDLADARMAESAGWKSVAEESNSIVKELVPRLDLLADFFKKMDVTPRPGDTQGTDDPSSGGGST
jgi:hypothetical protein